MPHLPAVMSKELLVSACAPQEDRRAACKRRQDAGTMSRREGCMGQQHLHVAAAVTLSTVFSE